jgi:ABC-type transporter Mla subunit MlaD
MEPFITARLEAANINSYTETIKAVIANINQFLRILAQSYNDLDETRTSELQLIELKQNASVSEYLTRFTQYSFRVY